MARTTRRNTGMSAEQEAKLNAELEKIEILTPTEKMFVGVTDRAAPTDQNLPADSAAAITRGIFELVVAMRKIRMEPCGMEVFEQSVAIAKILSNPGFAPEALDDDFEQ